MQRRAAWCHHGGTWALPGGARDSHEDDVVAALREAGEETGLDRSVIRARHRYVDDHGGWAYTTVYADIPHPVPTRGNRESASLEWVAVERVAELPLHPGFAQTWPVVRARPTLLLVDAANVVGSRPDGWWRDRAGAAARLLDRLSGLRAATVVGPEEATRVIGGVAVVLEGAAQAAADPGWVLVRRAGGRGGDDVLVTVAEELLAEGHDVLAVSADRGLRARWLGLASSPGGAPMQVVGPGRLLGLLDALEDRARS